MTPSEVRELAFVLLGEWGVSVNNTPWSLLYQRMSDRQRELFGWAGNIDPDFFGECVVVTLDQGGANLKQLEASNTIYPIEYIQIIRVQNPGTSSLATGTRVRIVRADDTRELAPRVTFRSGIIRGVGTDLDGVTSLKIWYIRRPHEIGLDGGGNIELPDPYHSLLAYDLAKYILQRDPQLSASPAITALQAEEDRRLAAFEAHIRGSYQALEARFG